MDSLPLPASIPWIGNGRFLTATAPSGSVTRGDIDRRDGEIELPARLAPSRLTGSFPHFQGWFRRHRPRSAWEFVTSAGPGIGVQTALQRQTRTSGFQPPVNRAADIPINRAAVFWSMYSFRYRRSAETDLPTTRPQLPGARIRHGPALLLGRAHRVQDLGFDRARPRNGIGWPACS